MKKLLPTLTSITIFSIAMAFLETAVVIYLRELLYPGGFNFPLAPMPGKLVLTEILREFATIIMLAGAGVLAGKTFSQRFAWFIYSFAIWDIFYYVFLKVFIEWPVSILDPDILFFIPLPWWGPVLAPIMISLLMITAGARSVMHEKNGVSVRTSLTRWALLAAGILSLLYVFMADALKALPASTQELGLLRPTQFNWPVFSIGYCLAVVALWLMLNHHPIQSGKERM